MWFGFGVSLRMMMLTVVREKGELGVEGRGIIYLSALSTGVLAFMVDSMLVISFCRLEWASLLWW